MATGTIKVVNYDCDLSFKRIWQSQSSHSLIPNCHCHAPKSIAYCRLPIANLYFPETFYYLGSRFMKKEEIHIVYRKATNPDELSPSEKSLFNHALDALETAYAPYSQFKVGCAVRLSNGKIVIGSNQENMAYPSGLCAERVAIFSASAQYPGVPIQELAVVAKPLTNDSELTISPCGSCRQVMMEYERVQNEPMKIITGSATGPIFCTHDAGALLPLAFFDGGLTK